MRRLIFPIKTTTIKQTKQNKENALRKPGASGLIFGFLDLWFYAPFLASAILPQRGPLSRGYGNCFINGEHVHPSNMLRVICDELLNHLGAVAICYLRHAMKKSDNFLKHNNRPV